MSKVKKESKSFPLDSYYGQQFDPDYGKPVGDIRYFMQQCERHT